MKRRGFIQSAAPVTLALLSSFPDTVASKNTSVPDDVFAIELRRRFEDIPSFLKGDGCKFNLATAVLLLSRPNPSIRLLSKGKEEK